jgi:hypothetical protein
MPTRLAHVVVDEPKRAKNRLHVDVAPQLDRHGGWWPQEPETFKP